MSEKIFISRSLAEHSPVQAFAEKNNLELKAISLIEFTPVYFSHLPKADWLFFYSKNGVRFFMRALQEKGLKIKVPVAVIGLGTLNALKEFGKSADFAGNGQPEEVAAAFKELARGQHVLFIRAQQSRRSIQQLLEEDLTVKELPVYANEIRLPDEEFQADYLLFTSPLNAEAYAQKYDLNAAQVIVAIGGTTADKLRSLGAKKVWVATSPNETSMVKCLEKALATAQ
jgi:uroporphyrinogen-III synthase